MMRRRERSRSGHVHNAVSDDDTEQHHNHNIADAAYSSSAANIVERKRRKDTPGMRGAQHRFPVTAMSRFRCWLKPEDLEKVAKGNSQGPKKTMRRRGTGRD